MEAPVVSFWIWDAATQTLDAQACTFRGARAQYPVTRLRADEGHVGLVAKHQKALNVPPVLDPKRCVPLAWCRRNGPPRDLPPPVVLEGALLAVLARNATQPPRPHPD